MGRGWRKVHTLTLLITLRCFFSVFLKVHGNEYKLLIAANLSPPPIGNACNLRLTYGINSFQLTTMYNLSQLSFT